MLYQQTSKLSYWITVSGHEMIISGQEKQLLNLIVNNYHLLTAWPKIPF